jgi:hypothetical protein
MTASLKTVAAVALAVALSFTVSTTAQAGVTIQSGGATGCCRMIMQ